MITDILSKGTTCSWPVTAASSSAPSASARRNGVLELPGVMSRKKQVAPKLLAAR